MWGGLLYGVSPAVTSALRGRGAGGWSGRAAQGRPVESTRVNAVATVATGGYAGLQLLDTWVQALRHAGGFRGTVFILTDRPDLVTPTRFPGGPVEGVGVEMGAYFPRGLPDYAPNVLKADLLALLPPSAERILFLDLDILVSNHLEPVERNIASLYTPETAEFPHAIAGWTDVICRGLVPYLDPDACMMGSYLNAGAFFVDRRASGDCMRRWKEAMVGRDGAPALVGTLPRDDMVCPAFASCGRDDQYALNHLLRSGDCGSWALLSPHYNWGMNSWLVWRALQKLRLPKKTLSHFTSAARAKIRTVPAYRRRMTRWLREVGVDTFFDEEGELLQARSLRAGGRGGEEGAARAS